MFIPTYSFHIISLTVSHCNLQLPVATKALISAFLSRFRAASYLPTSCCPTLNVKIISTPVMTTSNLNCTTTSNTQSLTYKTSNFLPFTLPYAYSSLVPCSFLYLCIGRLPITFHTINLKALLTHTTL